MMTIPYYFCSINMIFCIVNICLSYCYLNESQYLSEIQINYCYYFFLYMCVCVCFFSFFNDHPLHNFPIISSKPIMVLRIQKFDRMQCLSCLPTVTQHSTPDKNRGKRDVPYCSFHMSEHMLSLRIKINYL